MRIESHGDLSKSSINVLTGPFEARLEQPIRILDSTLREGEQPPGVVFTPDEKMEIARALDEFGVPWAAVGYPAVSEKERQGALRICKAGFRFKTSALARVVAYDIDVAADCGVDQVTLFIGGSDSHLADKLRLTEDQAVDRLQAAVRHAKERGVQISFAVEDFSRSPLPRVLRFCQAAVEAGADELGLPDTLGVMTPSSTFRIFSLLHALFTVPLGVHFHNDLGLALANTLAALEAGAELASSTFTGPGERTGNVCTEELTVVLKLKYGLDFGFRLDKIHEISQLVHRASGTRPSEHKPITGRWCFTHESGIHVAGILANPETYQPFPPELVGRHHEIVFGKHSGAQGVAYLAEQAGLELSESGRRTVLERIKKEAERRHGSVPEEEILDWIRAEISSPAVTLA